MWILSYNLFVQEFALAPKPKRRKYLKVFCLRRFNFLEKLRAFVRLSYHNAILESKQLHNLAFGFYVCSRKRSEVGIHSPRAITSFAKRRVYRKGASPSGVNEVAAPRRDLDSKKCSVCSRKRSEVGIHSPRAITSFATQNLH